MLLNTIISNHGKTKNVNEQVKTQQNLTIQQIEQVNQLTTHNSLYILEYLYIEET